MQIAAPALSRLRNAQMRGDAIATIFEHLAFGVDKLGVPGAHVVLDYQDPSDAVVDGDLIPTITLALRPATLSQ